MLINQLSSRQIIMKSLLSELRFISGDNEADPICGQHNILFYIHIWVKLHYSENLVKSKFSYY